MLAYLQARTVFFQTPNTPYGGAAFAWDATTLISCAHCEPDTTSLFFQGQHLLPFQIKAISKCYEGDVALIRLEQPHGLPLFKPPEALPEKAAIFALRGFAECDATLTEGNLSSLTHSCHYRIRMGWPYLSREVASYDIAQPAPDNYNMTSGSPVVTAEGALIGMHTAGHLNFPVGYCVTHERLSSIIQKL